MKFTPDCMMMTTNMTEERSRWDSRVSCVCKPGLLGRLSVRGEARVEAQVALGQIAGPAALVDSWKIVTKFQ